VEHFERGDGCDSDVREARKGEHEVWNERGKKAEGECVENEFYALSPSEREMMRAQEVSTR
jgi:hypothetical protein